MNEQAAAIKIYLSMCASHQPKVISLPKISPLELSDTEKFTPYEGRNLMLKLNY